MKQMSKAKLIEENSYEDIIYERDLESNLLLLKIEATFENA